MNKKDILQLLSNLFSNFYFHPRCIEEIKELLSRELRGKEERFFNVLQTQLSNIQTFGPMIYTVDSHERIKGSSKPYFSIHLQQSQFNIRMLVYISNEFPPLFLCAFFERSGKTVTDYSQKTAVLDARLEDMFEEAITDED